MLAKVYPFSKLFWRKTTNLYDGAPLRIGVAPQGTASPSLARVSPPAYSR